jgi:hypothetical protein
MRGMGSPLQQGAAESSTIRSGSREPVRWQHGHVHACHRQLLPCCLALTCGALGPGHRCASAAACKHCPGSQGGPGNTGKRTAALCSVSLPCHCIDTSVEAVLCSCSSQGNSYVQATMCGPLPALPRSALRRTQGPCHYQPRRCCEALSQLPWAWVDVRDLQGATHSAVWGRCRLRRQQSRLKAPPLLGTLERNVAPCVTRLSAYRDLRHVQLLIAHLPQRR